jgi:hypothetical protein
MAVGALLSKEVRALSMKSKIQINPIWLVIRTDGIHVERVAKTPVVSLQEFS